jgi:hypothetical protein
LNHVRATKISKVTDCSPQLMISTSTSPDRRHSTSQKREFHEKKTNWGSGKQTTHEPSGLKRPARCESPCCCGPSLVAVDFLALAGLSRARCVSAALMVLTGLTFLP